MLRPLIFFLFGARGTGKTTFIHEFITHALAGQKVLIIDLLDPDVESRYALRPGLLKEQLEHDAGKYDWVFIDEVQKVPKLLNVVQGAIENLRIKFIMSGSSARKLKRKGTNLLGGRAFEFKMHPLCHQELGTDFDLECVLKWGSLPKIFSFSDPLDKKRFLNAYTHVYLREEIQQEQIVRNIPAFRSFLRVAAQHNGEIINFARIGRDAGIDEKSVSRFFQILVDTLVGYYLEPYHRSVRKQQSQKPKFYLFDPGAARAWADLLDVDFHPSTYYFGKAFEHFIVLELLRLNDYYEKSFSFSYLQSNGGLEIDLIIERPGRPLVVAEIKSGSHITCDDTRHLESVLPDFPGAEFLVICREKLARNPGHGILILPWQEALGRILGT